MQVKKFEAPTIQEALDTIKRELGPEAIILQTKKMKKGFGLMSKDSVEVTAAVSERSTQKKAFGDKRLPEAQRTAMKSLPAEKQGDIYDKMIDSHLSRAATTREQVELNRNRGPQKRYVDIADERPRASARPLNDGGPVKTAAPAPRAPAPASASRAHQAAGLMGGSGAISAPLGSGMSVEEELMHLKRMITEMQIARENPPAGTAIPDAAQGLSTPALSEAFDHLVLGGLDKKHAYGLVKKAAFELGDDRAHDPDQVLDQLAHEIMETTQTLAPLTGISPTTKAEGAGPSVIALVGPTGVGKTTTVAKLASEALLRRNLRVGLINLDSYKVAASDQLSTYAKILNVPYRSVGTAEELQAAVRDFQQLDVVFIDTTGRSQRDPKSLKEMQTLLSTVEGIRTELVLSITTRDAELYDMANRFLLFKPEGIIASKLDEARQYGAIYNVSQKVKLPLLYFTTGQRVPEDIEEASRERVAALLMEL